MNRRMDVSESVIYLHDRGWSDAQICWGLAMDVVDVLLILVSAGR